MKSDISKKIMLQLFVLMLIPLLSFSQTKDEPIENEMINFPLDYEDFTCGYSSPYEVTFTYNFDISKYPVTNYEYCQMLNDYLSQQRISVVWDPEIESWLVKNTEGQPYELIDAQAFFSSSDYKITYDEITYFKVIEGYENYPIYFVTFPGAAFYCNYLSEAEGFEKLYDLSTNPWTRTFYGTTGFRIPTTQEWEYSFSYKDNRDYAWGNDNPTTDHANYVDCGIGKTTLVNNYPIGVSELGIFDLCGNLSEMTNNFSTSYDEAQENPTGPKDPTNPNFPAVDTKGGNYSSTGGALKRYWNGLFAMYNITEDDEYIASGTPTIGFRVLKTYSNTPHSILENQVDFNIYPNPSNGTFTIQNDELQIKNIEISDITGRIIFNATRQLMPLQINISNHRAGIYFVTIQTENQIFTHKLIIQ